MHIYDITRPIQVAPLYPGSEPFRLDRISSIAAGDSFNMTMLCGDSHLGTHLDAPAHALLGGKTIEQLALTVCYGPCQVVTVPSQTLLQPEQLSHLPADCPRLLLRSNGTSHLSEAAAQVLAERDLLLLGTDGLSIAPMDNELTIHQILLQRPILLLENLTLTNVPDGSYLLSALPLAIQGGDGSPVRAVLIEP